MRRALVFKGEAKFEVGQIVVTPSVTEALARLGLPLDDLVERHRAGDWGDVNEQTRLVNDRGLEQGFNLQSAYELAPGTRIIIVTNRDRSLTMVHLEGGAPIGRAKDG